MNKIYLIIAIIILGYIVLVMGLIEGFHQMPSPIFGGDYYFQLGSVQHVMDGGDPFQNSAILGTNPTYSPLYAIFIAGFAKTFGLTAMQGIFWANIPIIIFAFIVCFFLFKSLTKSDLMGMIGCLFFLSLSMFPVLKYTEMATILMVPIFIYCLYRFYENSTFSNMILLGVSYGLIGLFHAVGLVGGFSLILFFGVASVWQSKDIHLGVWYISPLLMGFAFSMLWWYGPVIEMQGQSLSRVSEWGFQNFTDGLYQLDFLISALTGAFFVFPSILNYFILICAVLGIYLLFKTKERTIEDEFVILFAIGAGLLTFHYFLTAPLGLFYAPNYMALFWLRPTVVFLAVFGLHKLMVTNTHNLKNTLIVLSAMVILIGTYMTYADWQTDRWKLVGKQEIPQPYRELQAYLLANTSVNDVILSSNELSFAVNSLSGRKVIAFRRGHVDPFINHDINELTAAIILYGNNTIIKLNLINGFNIRYIYIDPNWIGSEFNFDSISSFSTFDPLTVFDTQENRKILDENGIKYTLRNWWLDPSMQGGAYRKINYLLVLPSNYVLLGNRLALWKTDIDPYLTKVWSDSSNSSALYKIGNPRNNSR